MILASALFTVMGVSFVYVALVALLLVHPGASRALLVGTAACWMWTYTFWGTVWHAREVTAVFDEYDWGDDRWLIGNIISRLVTRGL